MTYRTDLLNTGTTIPSPIIARLTSLDPSSVQVAGQGELNFASAPTNTQVAGSNTFTILTDPTAPLDFSKLSWAYYSRRNVPPRRPRPIMEPIFDKTDDRSRYRPSWWPAG